MKVFTKNSLFAVGFLGFCLLGALSAFYTGVSITAIIFQLRAFIITFLLIFIIKGLNITKQDVLSFLWTTVTVGLILCIQGIVEKISNRTLFLPESWASMWLPETNRIRIYGLIGNPNVFGTYLVFVFFITLYLKGFYQKYKLILSILSVIFFGVFLLTFSRGTIIALVIGFIVYIALSRNWKIFKMTALSVILAIPLVYFPVVSLTNYVGQQLNIGQDQNNNGKSAEKGNGAKKAKEGFSKRMSESFDTETVQQSMEWGRLYVVKKGIEILKDHPVIGTGFGTYGDSATLIYKSPITEKYNLPKDMYSDNQYIQVMVQTGILGIAFFALFILGIIVPLWKRKKIKPLSLPVIAILIGGSIAGVFYNIWEDKTFTLYFYLILGFVLNNKINDSKEIIKN
jgi:hypothetical protein